VGVGGDRSPSHPEFASAAIRVAEANPRLLVTAPGWKVVRANEFEATSGDVTFGDGTHDIQLTWSPAKYYEGYYLDRSTVDPDPQFFDVLGQRARTVAYSDHDFATMLPPQGKVFVEIRVGFGGGGLDEDTYRQVIESLRAVDVDTWLGAMPATVVRPVDRAGTVDEMLTDIPLPPGFDIGSLRTEDAVLDRYQLGARVTGAVTCGWLDRWVAATRAGDAAGAREAVEALQTSHDWPILHEMTVEGEWPTVVRGFADQLAEGRVGGVGRVDTHLDEFTRSYSSAFGCG
jgi:hypothetical protein